MSPPTITCVIPAFNRERSLERAVRSALDQDSPPQEVIVVDDGSTDGTRDIARGMGSQVLCVSQENAGGAEARNRGVREARSEWVAFLDSDDYWTPTHLARMREAIAGTQGRADFYFANVRRSESEGGHDQWQQARFGLQQPWKLNPNGQDWVLRPRIPMMLQASVFHRERFLQKGGLTPALRRRHDTDCFLSHGTGYPVCATNHVGTVMTADEGSSNRLTGMMDPDSVPYWQYSVDLWKGLLTRLPELEGPGRSLLELRLFTAYWRLMRLSIRAGQPWQSAVHLLAAMRTSPGFLADSLLGRRPDEHDIVPSDAIEEGIAD